MKKYIFTLIMLCASTICFAQNDNVVFKGYLYNSDYQVFLNINFYDNNITSAAQPIFGQMPGYFGAKRDPREWFITNATITSKKTAKLDITNDYGSEDLTATLTSNNDSTFTLTQNSGSRMKIAVNRKWVKLPTTLVFKRK